MNIESTYNTASTSTLPSIPLRRKTNHDANVLAVKYDERKESKMYMVYELVYIPSLNEDLFIQVHIVIFNFFYKIIIIYFLK